MAVIVTNIHEKTKYCTGEKKHRLSKLIRTIFLTKIAKILGMERRAKDLLKQMIKQDIKKKEKKKKNKGNLK